MKTWVAVILAILFIIALGFFVYLESGDFNSIIITIATSVILIIAGAGGLGLEEK